MGRIFKYEMRRRLNMIFILSTVMIVLSVGTILLIVAKGINFNQGYNGSAVFWWYMITFFACIFIPTVMFFMCSNGHVDELLYKDTNYLMLTIPVRSESVLGGRILAGFVEFSIYSILSLIFFIIFAALQASRFGGTSDIGFYSALSAILQTVFVYNTLPTLYFVFLTVSGFLLVGTVFICVKALTRSFIRRKTLAQFIAVILFILVMSQVERLGRYLSSEWGVVQYIDVYMTNIGGGGLFYGVSQPMPVYLITVIMMFLLSVGFFVCGSWLVAKKVEL